MATTVTRIPDTTLSGTAATLRYKITGTASESTALAALLSAADTTFGGLTRDDEGTGIEEIHVVAGDDDTAMWLGVVRYGRRTASAFPSEQLASGEVAVTYDFGGGSQHITHSISTVDSEAAAGVTPTDYKQAIGVTPDGDVSGVDIEVLSIAYTIRKNYALVNLPSVATLKAVAKTVNSGVITFTDSRTGQVFSAAAGEAFMSNISGPVEQPDGGWEITYTVRYEENQTSVVIGGLDAIDKQGHDYLWVAFEAVEDATAKTKAIRPKEVIVDRVYPRASWSGL